MLPQSVVSVLAVVGAMTFFAIGVALLAVFCAWAKGVEDYLLRKPAIEARVAGLEAENAMLRGAGPYRSAAVADKSCVPSQSDEGKA